VASKLTPGYANNRLLASLDAPILALLADDFKEVDLAQGTAIQEAGEVVTRVHFPQTGMISLLVMTQDGVGIEATTIGREGALGMQSGFGKRRAFTRAIIQIEGRFTYISADRFQKAMSQNAALRDIVSTYTEILWSEAQQIAACNAIHSAEARLCRWLLQTRDRIGSDTLTLTQEFLSQMLGVRRTTVTLVARGLQAGGMIKYSRGHIRITDGDALERSACECYGVMQQEGLPARLGLDIPSRKAGL
jgi:CRP-like cAMP-binding protein